MRRIANRFAEAGYIALLPEFFGEGPRVFCVLRALNAIKRSGGRPFEQIQAAKNWLDTHDKTASGRIGVAGFCIGGSFAVLYAAKAPLKVVAAFYGEVPEERSVLADSPPIFAGFGKRDRVFGPGAVRLKRHAQQLGVAHNICEYADAGHSYMSQHHGVVATLGRISPMKVGYNAAAAEDSWQKMLQFFAQYLEHN